MVLTFVDQFEVIVPEDAIADSKRFRTGRKQISVFKNYWYYFQCYEEDEGICVFLYLEVPTPVKVTCSFVIKENSNTFVQKLVNHAYWGFDDFGKKDDLFENGVMKVNVMVNIQLASDMNAIVVDNKNKGHFTASLFDDDKFKDFVIRVEEQDIEVHKNIIAAASPVFAAMLEPHTKEFQESRVDIEDFDFETVKSAVELIYKRELDHDLPFKTLLKLYKFADKYDLVDMDIFFDALDSKLTLATFGDVMAFAIANSLNKLQEKCQDFFKNLNQN